MVDNWPSNLMTRASSTYRKYLAQIIRLTLVIQHSKTAEPFEAQALTGGLPESEGILADVRGGLLPLAVSAADWKYNLCVSPLPHSRLHNGHVAFRPRGVYSSHCCKLSNQIN